MTGLHVRAELQREAFALRAEFSAPCGLTVLFGPSGAGKSLTLQAIAGLAPITGGHIALDGRILADTEKGITLPPNARRVGYVPQSYALFPHLTVAGNIGYGLPSGRRGFAFGHTRQREAMRQRIAELLDLVHLAGFENRWPGELSGGEAQRIALARALAIAPDALLLDEPFSALDAPVREALRENLRGIVAASNIPVVMVTHDLAEARALADRLVVLVDGKVLAEGPVGDVLATPPTADTARLLGWRNIIPAVMGPGGDGAAEAELRGGQRVRVPGASGNVGAVQLALHADLIALDNPNHSEGRAQALADHGGGHATLHGVVVSCTDAGAYRSVRLALNREAEPGEVLTVTCSPREWAALDLAPGMQATLRIPPEAMRLLPV